MCAPPRYEKSTLAQDPCMARCPTGPSPGGALRNPPFFCLHERLAGRETEHEGANVVINETLAMHGILTSLPRSRAQPCVIDTPPFIVRAPFP